jgi:hypothetical protein
MRRRLRSLDMLADDGNIKGRLEVAYTFLLYQVPKHRNETSKSDNKGNVLAGTSERVHSLDFVPFEYQFNCGD